MSRIPKIVDKPETTGLPKSLFSRKPGRPPNAMAGDVDERILNAATATFIERGFGGASLDRIAEAAGASKATLYSRYDGKDALFAEVVRRNCEQSLQLAYEKKRSGTLPEQLVAMTQLFAARLISDEVIGLIRMVVAEAPRFPALAKLTHDAGRARTIDAVATTLAEYGQRTKTEGTRQAAKQHAQLLAVRIHEAVVSPMIIRALLSENLAEVRAEIPQHAKETVDVFAAAGALAEFM